MPSIFPLQDHAGLVEMTQQPYESERLLQRLLAAHPSILAGDQFNGSEPKRWLLIDREVGVPEEQDGCDRWSLDHLFVDEHGIPTLVEVKRISDTLIRREVIGQRHLDQNAVNHRVRVQLAQRPFKIRQANVGRQCHARHARAHPCPEPL